MLVRPAVDADAPAIARVHVDTWRSSYRGIVPDAYLDALDVERRTGGWRKMLAKERCLVSEDDSGAVVAFACFGESKIYALYVADHAQRRGHGRALLAAALHAMKPPRTVHVLEGNPALDFYEAEGGVIVGQAATEIGGASLVEIVLCFDDSE